jgi:hypothetical protein
MHSYIVPTHGTQDGFNSTNYSRLGLQPIKIYNCKPYHIRSSSDNEKGKAFAYKFKRNIGISLHSQLLPSGVTNKFILKKPIIRIIIQNMLNRRETLYQARKHTLTPLVGSSLAGILPINRLSVDLRAKYKKRLNAPMHKTLFQTYNSKMLAASWTKKRVITSGKLKREGVAQMISAKFRGYSCWEREKEEASFSNGILNVN